jgi:ParB family chromosome partitioning protein
MGHARTLLALPDSATASAFANECIKGGWSVRETETKVKAAQQAAMGEASKPTGKTKARPVWLNELEETLVETFGIKVAIRYGRKRSQIILECAGREQFERVVARLKDA